MTAITINREQLKDAIIELNSMSRAEGIVMRKDGTISVGNQTDEQTLCMLVPAPLLARQLTAAGLSCYTAKELAKWAMDYPLEPLETILSTCTAQL